MFDTIPFVSVPGEKTEPELFLFSLSTCAFCRKGMEFLTQNGFAYKYCHLDSLELDQKQTIKDNFKAEFGKTLSYPTLIVNKTKLVVGFIRRNWEEALGLPVIEEL